MPRNARVRSHTGAYHVMIKGVGRQSVFEDSSDRLFFLDLLARAKEKHGISIAAWCLMRNHIHIELIDERGELSEAVKLVSGCYAQYFNKKYDRTGHLFQNRFLSKPIEDEAYFYAVMNYIHANPERAGLCRMGEYRWSSFGEYMGCAFLTDTEPGLLALGGVSGFFDYSSRPIEGDFLYDGPERPNMEAHLMRILHSEYGILRGEDLQALAKHVRDPILARLKKEGGTAKQISTLTGIGRSIIERA